MMQKNLSCRTLKDSQKNMYSYGMAFIPVNLLFLSLGILLAVYAETKNISLPALSDEMLPMFATQYLGSAVIVFFSIGIIAAAFSSADSALTALTTSFCIDILDVEKFEENRAEKIRKLTHISISVLFVLIILVIKAVNNKSIIDAIYIIASYTYGPLLGLFSFGLFTKLKADDKWIPYIAFISPIFCFLLDLVTTRYTDYRFGYELLMMNGLFTFFGLYLTSVKAQLKHNRL